MPLSQGFSTKVPHPLECLPGDLANLVIWWNRQFVLTGPQISLSVMPTVSTLFRNFWGKFKPSKFYIAIPMFRKQRISGVGAPECALKKKKKRIQAILIMHIKVWELLQRIFHKQCKSFSQLACVSGLGSLHTQSHSKYCAVPTLCHCIRQTWPLPSWSFHLVGETVIK